MSAQKLKSFRPLPPLRVGELVQLDHKDVKRINDCFVGYVAMLETLQKRVDKLEKSATRFTRK